MRPSERLFLYSLLRGLRPMRALEIGFFKGGSAMIFARALHENGTGRAVGIDPFPQADVAKLPLLDRYQLLVGRSPALIAEASQTLGGRFDFVLIDGMHTYSAVRADIIGVLPFLATEATILLHDSFHYGVHKALESCVAQVPGMIDCGLVCNAAASETDPPVDPWITYCGLHMLRYRQRTVSIEERLATAYRAWPGMEARFGPELLDHNEWACMDDPCSRCLQVRDELSASTKPVLVRATRTEGTFQIQGGKVRKLSQVNRDDVARARLIPESVLKLLPVE
jgi:hypothetical protein